MNILNQSSFEGHTGAVYTVCPSSQTGIFYSGAADGYLVEWDIKQPETGKVLFYLESPIYAICRLDDLNEIIAVGTANGLLHILNTKSKQIKHKIIAHQGAIFDFVLDLRLNSKTYLQMIAIKLDDQNNKQLFIPKGLAHGFLTLKPNTKVFYKVDQYYSKKHDQGFNILDPKFKITGFNKVKFHLSTKDKNLPFLHETN